VVSIGRQIRYECHPFFVGNHEGSVNGSSVFCLTRVPSPIAIGAARMSTMVWKGLPPYRGKAGSNKQPRGAIGLGHYLGSCS
jgi:hypothetical protein